MTAEIIPFETIIPLTPELSRKLDAFCALTGMKRDEVVQRALDVAINNPDRMEEIARQLAIEQGDGDPEAIAKRVRERAEKILSERSNAPLADS